jgi:hypothetical protein
MLQPKIKPKPSFKEGFSSFKNPPPPPQPEDHPPEDKDPRLPAPPLSVGYLFLALGGIAWAWWYFR